MKNQEPMATVIPDIQLKELISKGEIMKNGNVASVEGIKYDFATSSMLLKAKFGQPIDISKLSQTEKVDLYVEPGEVVFVLTEEVLNLPDDIKITLIPKRKLSHDGIMVLGGLSVDPLYRGRLLMGLYNFSSSPFPIQPGKKLIGAEFFRLSKEESAQFKKPEIEINEFPDDLIKLMQKYRPVSVQSLMDHIGNLERKLDDMRTEFRQRDDWFKKFQDSIDGHDKNISKILETLRQEVDDRKEAEKSLDKEMDAKYDKLNDTIQRYAKEAYKTAALVGTLGALIMSVILFLVEKILEK